MRVLLIEDEPTTAKAIELMLTTEGFNTYTTDLGAEGLDLGKLYDYDIILLDLNLPDMHGYDVLKKLRVARVSTPVIPVTPSAASHSSQPASAPGAPVASTASRMIAARAWTRSDSIAAALTP